jgi:hypothetical protein
MIKKLFSIIIAGSIALMLVSWGSQGHYKISYTASLSFFDTLASFTTWTQYLADHASDADDRKDTDPTEAPKHYIDIDNYPEFNSTGKIPQTWDSIVAAHGSLWVTDMGILPWSTEATYDSLKNAFINHNWDKAKFFAADLGHYVGDGYMPLHLTKNYDGQYTDNDGIHSRYESSMIYSFLSQIIYEGDTVRIIPNVNKYIFNYIYKNYKYKDSVLAADNYAQSVAGNTTSYTYKSALWSKTKGVTIMMFKNASHSLAELIFNAWAEAGYPALGSPASIDKYDVSTFDVNVFPNPVLNEINFDIFTNGNSEKFSATICNFNGQLIKVFSDKSFDNGRYHECIDASGFPSGLYFYSLTSGKSTTIKTFIKL